MSDTSLAGIDIPATLPPPENLPWRGLAYLDPSGGLSWLGPPAPTPAAAATALAADLVAAAEAMLPPPADVDAWLADELGRWCEAGPVLVAISATDERAGWRAWLALAQRPASHEALRAWRVAWPLGIDDEDPCLVDVDEGGAG